MKVTLTTTECTHAALEGCQRRIRKFERGTQNSHKHGYDGSDNWTAHVEGAGAELAVAKGLDAYWLGSSEPDYDGDVGDLQIRHTHRNNGRLIVHKTDPADAVYILVTGEMPNYVIRGWKFGFAAQDDKYWCDPGTGRPAYFVPQSELDEVEILRDHLKALK